MSWQKRCLSTIYFIIFVLFACPFSGSTAYATIYYPPYIGFQDLYWAQGQPPGQEEIETNGPTETPPVTYDKVESSYGIHAWSNKDQLKEKISGSIENDTLLGRAGLWQVYTATSESQTINFHWSGSITTDSPGPSFDLDSGLSYSIWAYDPEEEWWFCTDGNSWSRDITNESDQLSYNIDEDHDVQLTFEPGTTFGVEFILDSYFFSEFMNNEGTVNFSADFYDTGEITGVTGARPYAVPVPASVFLLGSGVIAALISTKRLGSGKSC